MQTTNKNENICFTDQDMTLGSLLLSHYLPLYVFISQGFQFTIPSYQDIMFPFYGLCCCPYSLAVCVLDPGVHVSNIFIT
jgi:hypothetical protein